MSDEYKEMVVRRPITSSQNRKYFYSENPQLPKLRVLLDQDEINDATEFHNACVEFTSSFQYHELTRPQRVLKILISFHGVANNGGVGHGIDVLQDDGVSPEELLQALDQVGAERQRDLIARYNEAMDSQLTDEYHHYKPDTIQLAVTYARQNLEQFVKLA